MKRRAAPQSTERKPQTPVEPLDESDQERLIQELRRDLSQQHAQVNQSFSYLIYAIVGTTLLATLYGEGTDYDDWRPEREPLDPTLSSKSSLLARFLILYHGLVGSPLLHLWARHLVVGGRSETDVKSSTNRSTLSTNHVRLGVILLWLLHVACWGIAWWSSGNYSSNNYPRFVVHSILLGGNLVTLAFTSVLRREQQSTEASLSDLKAAKYHFKSL